jgi:hypothetical protein
MPCKKRLQLSKITSVLGIDPSLTQKLFGRAHE